MGDLLVQDMKARLCKVFRQGLNRMAHRGRRKLVLHFDVNKTIVAVDTSTGEKVEDSLNVYLSGQAWGTEKEGKWELSMPHLSHSPMEKNAVSFYKFEETRLLRCHSESRDFFRYHLMGFTESPQGFHFKPHLDTLLECLQWKGDFVEEIHGKLVVKGKSGLKYHLILPSFYNLIRHLLREGRDFTIVFRTFGVDAKHVLESLKTAASGMLAEEDGLIDLSERVSQDIATMFRSSDDICLQTTNTENSRRSFNSDRDIYKFISESSGIWAVKDDIESWNKNSFHPSAGKPFWVDLADDSVQHIFFDDNIRPGRTDSIVDLRLRDRSCNSTGDSCNSFRAVDRTEESAFVNMNLAPVNFSSAILDKDYFINYVQLCEDNYSKYFSSEELLDSVFEESVDIELCNRNPLEKV